MKFIFFAVFASISVANAQDAVEDFLRVAADQDALQISEEVFLKLEAIGPETFLNHPKRNAVLKALWARANGSIPETGRNVSTRTQAMRLRHRSLSALAGLGEVDRGISENFSMVIESGLAPRTNALLPLERFVTTVINAPHPSPGTYILISNAYIEVFAAMKKLGQSDIFSAWTVFYEFSTSSVHIESMSNPQMILPPLVEDMYQTVLEWHTSLKRLAEREPDTSKVINERARKTYAKLLSQIRDAAARLGMDIEEEPAKPEKAKRKVRVASKVEAVEVDLSPKNLKKLLSGASTSDRAKLLAALAESSELSAESRQEYERLLRAIMVDVLTKGSLEQVAICARALTQ